MNLFRRRLTFDRTPHVQWEPSESVDGRESRALAEREELREAADRLTVALADMRERRDRANAEGCRVAAERDALKADLAQAHHELERVRAELANARTTATNADRLLAGQVRLAALPTDVVKLRHELAREREVRARQDERWAELGEMAVRTPARGRAARGGDGRDGLPVRVPRAGGGRAVDGWLSPGYGVVSLRGARRCQRRPGQGASR